jgi:DNA-binding PadR family transcriptional regulator
MSSKDQAATDDLTPLSPTVFHILLSLGEGERHGYALKREISLRTRGKLKLGPGVLYGSIKKLLELGLIEESDARPDPHLDDERRRYYRITPYGRKVAQAEAARMRELVRLARQGLERPSMPEPRFVEVVPMASFYPTGFVKTTRNFWSAHFATNL